MNKINKRVLSEARHERSTKRACVEEAHESNLFEQHEEVLSRSKEVQMSVETNEFGHQFTVDNDDKVVQCQINRTNFRSCSTQFSTQMFDQATQTENVTILESTICDEEELGIFDQNQSTLISTLNESSFRPSSDESDTSSEPTAPSYTSFIVFWSALCTLLKRCIQCGEISKIISYVYNGTLISVNLRCKNRHKWTRNSQPMNDVNQAEGNIRLAAGILFTGNVFQRIEEFFQFSNIRFFSKDTFYRYQNKFLFPVVNERWAVWTKEKYKKLNLAWPCKLTGDARCDSPGHSAKYSTYSFQDELTNEIVDFNVMQVTEVGSSNKMEKASFVKLLKKIEDNGVKVKQLTTDRHPSVRKYMREERKDINYQYDVWHVAKSIVKKLSKRSKKASCKPLESWITSIRNHFWWCCATCNGDVELLKEKWLSILHHIKDVHQWDSGKKYKECCHERLTKAQKKSKLWLKDNSDAYKALQSVVMEKKLLTDLEHVTQYSHTGNLEVYHSLINKYAPKRQHFHYRGMICRTQLSAMDHNSGVNSQQATTNKSRLRYKIASSKISNKWTAKPIKSKKDKSYEHEMVERAVEVCNKNVILEEVSIPELPKNIASTPRPEKDEVIASHRSQFSLS